MGLNSVYYRSGCGGNAGKVELKSLELKKDFNGYYLAAKFQVEDAHSVRELDIPHIQLCIDCSSVYIDVRDSDWDGERASVNLGFGKLPLNYGMSCGCRALFTEKILEEKYTEMTMDEIEKKLGYKVKIVNK
jgi:hypothetical protein